MAAVLGVGTRNRKKRAEIVEILGDLGLYLRDLTARVRRALSPRARALAQLRPARRRLLVNPAGDGRIPTTMSQKTWGGRFSGDTDRRVEAFTESIHFDRRLYRHDIRASQAH